MESSSSADTVRSLRSYSSNWSDRQISCAQSTPSYSSTSSIPAPRLADVMKEHGLRVHVENWRETTQPVSQFLPLQHILGSLKHDHEEKVQYRHDVKSTRTSQGRRNHGKEQAAVSTRSDDSFSDMLRSTKRRRIADSSQTETPSSLTSKSDRDSRYQAKERIPKEIPQAAVPGLNIAFNLATLTAEERNIVSEYAPTPFGDPQVLVNEVVRLRDRMMAETYDEETDEFTDDTNDDDAFSPVTDDFNLPIIPPEREAEVRRAFEDFVDLDGYSRFTAKI